MKKILLIAVLIGAMFSVSAYVVCIAAPLLGKSIKGSGNIVSKNIEAPDFNAVDASRAVKVIISAEASDIRIEADDNLIDLVIAKAKGKTLEVTLDQKANNLQNASITVTVPANGGNIRTWATPALLEHPIIPLIAVPTTAGTGSEVTFDAVITDTEAHEKLNILDLKIAPKVALVDPTEIGRAHV